MGVLDLKSEILQRIEALDQELETALAEAESKDDQSLVFIRDSLNSMQGMVSQDKVLFDIEPWHALEDGGKHAPGELLLRLEDKKGGVMAPYPFVQACYDQGLATKLDTILVLAALREFVETHRGGGEKQVSINISGRSLEPRNRDNIELILRALGELELDREVVFEILEGFANTHIDLQAMERFHQHGVSFAVDDVSLQVGDVFRLAGFGDHIKYVKLDYQFVQDHDGDDEAESELTKKLNFICNTAPKIVMIAEGVKDVDHARRLYETHDGIAFAQGRDLPAREVFAKEWVKDEESE